MSSKTFLVRTLQIAMAAFFTAMTGGASAAPLSIADNPLFLNAVVAPLNMLVVGRDHKMFYEAYADHSDLDGDGTLDVGYQGYVLKADGTFKINYFGYFDSFKCYAYSSNMFVPQSTNTNKRCSGQWSGDWLNWVTTARIDALRKVLYGGKRSTDDASNTVLERALVPQDAHSWGKEYASIANDGYDISWATPYAVPTAGSRHLFASVTLMLSTSWTTNNSDPLLRVLLNQPSPRRIWHWVSKESPDAGGTMDTGGGNFSVSPTDFSVRVKVCVPSFPESNCKQYPNGNWKPTGLLQDFGENDTMLFGLLTGSYTKSKSGGVLRKQMGTIKDEINSDTDGTIKPLVGIIRTMDQLRAAGYVNYTNQAGGYGVMYQPGLVATRTFNEGEFGGNWGNPVGEMMYEALRYFAGKSGPTSAFNYTAPGIDGTAPLSLPKVDVWQDPYRSGKPSCAKPFETVMSDVNTSYDSDQVPGSYFNGFSGDLPGLDASKEGDTIWNNEFGAPGAYFIGQSGAVYDGAPTPKTVNSFASIRGLAPEEPTKEGSYYAASVAHYGLTTDVNPAPGQQKVQTFAVALASPLPRIEIPVGNGKMVTLVPFAKSVGGASINAAQGAFQPTNQIVDFYVENIAADRKSGSFQVNFEDVEAGNDHDMDAISRYAYVVNADNTITVTITSTYAAGGIVQHMGYVMSGTTHDGIYLEVRDADTVTDTDYFLDTPDGFNGTPPAPSSGVGRWNDGVNQPLTHTRTFTPGPTTEANVLKDPLWYAAKWGGFEDTNNNNVPDIQSEWDQNGDGNPDNYFLVTNALKLGDQLKAAFDEIIARVGSASSASVNTGSISSDTRVYQAKFNSGDWHGQLLSFPVNPADGSLLPAEWDAAVKLAGQTPTSRVIITNNSDTATANGIPFRWASLSSARQALLQPSDTSGSLRVDYLRGDNAKEQKNGGLFRDRASRLGDIVSSSPVFVGKPPFVYPDTLESQPYSTFVTNHAGRAKMVYVGANDGMLHGFDAGTSSGAGEERLAFVPRAVFPNLIELTKPNYAHKFYVDGTPTIGDAFYGSAWHTVLLGNLNKGGKSIFALDVTDPNSFSETNANSILRWEFTHPDLGYTYSRPAIVRMHNGKWAAVFGNGYNNTTGTPPTSADGKAKLFIVDIETGLLMSTLGPISTNAGNTTTPNGLATPAVVDLDGDSIVDFAYAGDLLGNLWKFDLRSASADSWGVAYGGTPLFIAKDKNGVTQPITSKPEVGRGPKGQGMIVLFGTGKFLEQVDKSPTQTQTFYGVVDQNTGTAATDAFTMASPRTVLTQQTILAEQTFSFTTTSGTTVTAPLRVTSANAIGTNRGWYMDLLSPPAVFKGEMQVSNSVLRNGRIIFTTLVPDADPCSAGGTSWLMEMDALSGSRLTESPFDPNQDSVFSEGDMVTITLSDGTTITVPASGIQSDVGIAQGPGILFDPGTSTGAGPKEYKYLSGSNANAAGSNLQQVVENPGPNSRGRQSWRQVK